MLSLPYHEPSAADVLLLSSLFLILNSVNYALNSLLYCGLIGQVLIGVAFGTPGAKWLGVSMEEVIVKFGYIGLILLIFEGGLSTSFRALKANLVLSTCIALTGVGVPMGLSFILERLTDATPLQAFAAGAALCATSLGTTFTVLSTTGLNSSRLGVALTCAAMIDDVIGLVMVQVISKLGESEASVSAGTVLRPIFTSLGLVTIAALAGPLVVKPATEYLNSRRLKNRGGVLSKLMGMQETALVLHTLLLFGLVAASSYAGASVLFASYIAGASISWWDSEVTHVPVQPIVADATASGTRETEISSTAENAFKHEATSGVAIFRRYYYQPLAKVFQPLFFASIGFSIPISRMFEGSVVWRGFVYAALMALGKLVCGLWLVRVSLPWQPRGLKRLSSPRLPHLWGAQRVTKVKSRARKKAENQRPAVSEIHKATEPMTGSPSTTVADQDVLSPPAHHLKQEPSPSSARRADTTTDQPDAAVRDYVSVRPRKPTSLYPASILGWAMVARGEIGFLISSIAESNGIFSSQSDRGAGPSEIFLIVTWAIVICTVIGPIAVGLLVRRVKRLERGVEHTPRADVLGVWGLAT